MREHEYIVTVDAPPSAGNFNAGIIMLDDWCVRAAPILKWCLGRNKEDLSAYFKRRGWKATIRRIDLGQLVSLGGAEETPAT